MKAEKKEYNRLENPKIMENVLFTKLVTKDMLNNQKIGEYIGEMIIISHQQKLKIIFTEIGMIGAKKDFDKMVQILEDSVLYN